MEILIEDCFIGRNAQPVLAQVFEAIPPGQKQQRWRLIAEMTTMRLLELEEMSQSLLKTAQELPAGQERHNALREIGRFRARIAALRGPDLSSANRGPEAKVK